MEIITIKSWFTTGEEGNETSYATISLDNKDLRLEGSPESVSYIINLLQQNTNVIFI